MAKVERIREVVTGSVDMDYVRQKTDAGWKLVALEWRRELPGDESSEAVLMEEIPYGLRVSSDCNRLEEDPHESSGLVQKIGLILPANSITQVASTLQNPGLRNP